MKARFCGTLLVAAALVGLSGCAFNANEQAAPPASEMELLASPVQPIQDVPVPVGFKLNQSRSWAFAGGGSRYIVHQYKGGEDKFAVARFFRSQMPRNRWALVSDRFVRGELVMDFEKETERCCIVLTDGGLWHATQIDVTLWTSGRIPQPRTRS